LFIAALFLGVSMLSSSVPGVNEPHYLTKSRAFDDPAWCSRDFFLTSGNAHYTFFWIVGILTRWFTFDTIAVIGRIVSALLLGLGWSVLGRSLAMPATWRLVAACIFASLSLLGSFSGEWLLGGFESKVPAWGFCLMAVGFWIQGHQRTCPGWMTIAGVACGLGCALHPVVGGWIAACLCFASLVFVILRRERVLKSLVGLMCFAIATIVLSLPGLIPALQMVIDTSLPEKERKLASFYQVFWRLKHHLDPTEFSVRQWIYTATVGCGILIGTVLLRRRPADLHTADDGTSATAESKRLPNGFDGLLMVFMMSAMIAFAGVIIGWHFEVAQKMTGWQWRASLLKFYPFRCFDGLLPITLSLIAAQLVSQRLRALMASKSVAVLTLIVLVSIPLGLAWRSRDLAPAGYKVAQFADWQQACDWIRNNTPQDALFLTPRESFAFKWFAERAEFVCYKDCPQDAAGILTWNERLWMLNDWTSKSSADLQYGDDDLRVLRERTGCDFIITRILGPFETPPVWQGAVWSIYAVPK
jgi:hypothetical protein